ncbi:MAG: general secretion pathway protein GspE, partial [Glaciecola sp.]|nr:general secretion pathway protein GspE [Glaciecola sp.]
CCDDIGYKGRTGVHELLTMTPELRGLIYKSANLSELARQAANDGMRTLMQDGIKKVLSGITDIKQIQILGGLE